MKLSDHLLYRDIQELGLMATYYECDCNRNSKLELVQSIHHHMLKQSVYNELLGQIEPSLFHFLQYILFQPTATYSIDELIAKGKYICQIFNYDQSPRKWVTQLMKRGWLFPASKNYQIQLEIPSDLHEFLKRQMLEYFKPTYLSIPQQNVFGSLRDEGKLILFDIHTFLAYVKERLIPVTLDGVIHKRYQQMINQKLNISEEEFKEKKWRFGYGRRFPAYPSRFALLYDFCFSKEWVIEGKEGLLLTSSGEEIVNSNPMWHEKIHVELFTYWIKVYKHPIPSLPFIYTFLADLLSNQWLDLDQVYTMIQPWLKPYYFDDVPTIFRERIIQMMVHLGVLQMFYNKEDQRTYLSFNRSRVTENHMG